MVTFAPENAPALKFTVSWHLGYEMRNSKVKLTRARAEDHVSFNYSCTCQVFSCCILRAGNNYAIVSRSEYI